VEVGELAVGDVPEVLTVEEAARVLRISRGLAYQLARRFVESGGHEGLPVLRLGRRLLVPRLQIERLLSGELPIDANCNAAQVARSRPNRAHRKPTSSARLALIPPEHRA
jgi:hypothetical protein